jgi:hypothetical protein
VTAKSDLSFQVRVTVYLSVHSEDMTPERISDLLGVTPDSTRRKGALNKAGKPLPKNIWTIKSERHLPDVANKIEEGINACLRDVLSRVEPPQCSFGKLTTREHSSLLIGILAGSVPPLIIEGDLLRRMASLPLDHFEIDLMI